MFSEDFTNLRGLESKFTGRDEEECLDLVLIDVDLLKGGYDKSSGFACAVLCTSKNISFGEGDGDGFFLYWGGFFETCLENAHKEFTADEHVFKFGTLGGGYIFCLWP